MDETNRELGNLGLSIGTSMAFEAIVEDHSKVNNIDVLYINVRTLIRNYYHSFTSQQKKELLPGDIVKGVGQEIEQIISVLESVPIKIAFFYPTYDDLASKLDVAKLRQAKTELQIQYLNIEVIAGKALVEKFNNHVDITVTSVASKLDKAPTLRALMLTHTAVDLLNVQQFRELKLLESHTGNLKSKLHWGSKLTRDEIKERLPFNVFTLTIFGDNNTYLSSYPTKIKRDIIAMCLADNWTSATTLEKIKYSLMKVNDKFLRDWYLSICRQRF